MTAAALTVAMRWQCVAAIACDRTAVKTLGWLLCAIEPTDLPTEPLIGTALGDGSCVDCDDAMAVWPRCCDSRR